jgi:hypothetical protein
VGDHVGQHAFRDFRIGSIAKELVGYNQDRRHPTKYTDHVIFPSKKSVSLSAGSPRFSKMLQSREQFFPDLKQLFRWLSHDRLCRPGS